MPGGGEVDVWMFGRTLVRGEVVSGIDENGRAEVSIPGVGTVVITRPVDYIETTPLPFAPLTSRGLAAQQTLSLNALAEMEAGVVYNRRYGHLLPW